MSFSTRPRVLSHFRGQRPRNASSAALLPLLLSGQGTDHFNMFAVREHIDRGEALGPVAFFRQKSQVTGHGLRVAADVDHPLRGHAGHAGKEFRGRALARGVHKDHVCLLPCCGGFTDPAGGIGGKEAGVLYAVVSCVRMDKPKPWCVSNRVFYCDIL